MAKKSIKKNYIYNLLYQILVLITPLITTPYLSRVLGADGIGTVSFAESIISYFVLFATLGITTYGQREISYVQENKEKRTIVFWETKILEFMTSGIAIICYLIFALNQKNKSLYFVFLFNLIAVVADVTWFFQGIEEFRKIVLKNFIFKIINIIYIFVFVKSKNDITIYAFGLAFFLFLSNTSLWPYLPSYLCKIDYGSIRPFQNIRVVLSLFIPTIAIQIYSVLDKTMIGLITQSTFENGYYEQAIKISKTVLTVVTALGTVMIPRVGYYFGRNEDEKVVNLIYKAYRFVWFIGIPLCFGLISISGNFVFWFYGPGFEKVIPLLYVLSFLILAIGINNVTGMQYLIPTKRQGLFTLTVFIGAGVNFTMNLILIRIFKSIGAAIASVTAESIIALVQLFLVRKELSVKKVFLSSWHYLFAGGIMLFFLNRIRKYFPPSIIYTLVLIICGAIIYGFILIILRDNFLIENARVIAKKIFRKKS